jgi:hypothetical protein
MIRIGLFLCFAFLFLTVEANNGPTGDGNPAYSGKTGTGIQAVMSTGKVIPHEKGTAEDSIQFVYPMSTTVVKRKAPIVIRWKGGQPGTTYFLELFKDGIFEEQIAEIVDLNRYEWQVSKEIDGGDDFQFRLVNSRFFGDYAFSPKFRIKNRIPRAFWIVPAAVGAAGIYFLVKLIIDSRPEPEQPDLPAPIEPY